MKSLFWSKVQPKSLAGTVFMAMAQNEANSAKLDLFELENDFFDPAKEKSGGARGAPPERERAGGGRRGRGRRGPDQGSGKTSR